MTSIILIGVLLIIIGSVKMVPYQRTISHGSRIAVMVTKTDCYWGRKDAKLYFRHQGFEQNVVLSRKLCKGFRPGQEVELYYDASTGRYELKDNGVSDYGIWLINIGFIALMGALFRWLYSLYLKKWKS